MVEDNHNFIGGDGSEEFQSSAVQQEKDPRKIARKYQLKFCQKAIWENIIAYLGTGSGKTHIAVLLMYELGHLIKKPKNSICVFLAPTVALVQQQGRVIEESTDFKVAVYCGNSKSLKTHSDWRNEAEQFEVFVMTPQTLLYNLCHCFMKMEGIALLIFDECHHAQLDSSHPYAEIMKVFYKHDMVNAPRIFGMTASPKLGRGASISGLERLLHSKVYTIEDAEELEDFVVHPKIRVYQYFPSNDNTSSDTDYYKKLDDIKRQCVAQIASKTKDLRVMRILKKVLSRLHGNLVFCLDNLGICGAFQASWVLLNEDISVRNELVGAEGDFNDNSVYDEYLIKATTVFSSYRSDDGSNYNLFSVDVLEEPLFSAKLSCLVSILCNFRLQKNMKCIIFVNRIITARALSKILESLKVLSAWKCDFLVGVHSGLKGMSRRNMNLILKKFHGSELNLLIATKVGEEGLDIQTCCLVIRFDLPETVSSFIQSRGRARMPQSEYVFLVESGNMRDINLIKAFKDAEDQMNIEVDAKNDLPFIDFNEKVYKVDSTGATITSASAVSLIHHYCSKLSHDEYFDPKPEFFYFDCTDGTLCRLIMPSNSPIYIVISTPQSSRELAKKDACLKACEELHKVGALSSFLLPDRHKPKHVVDLYADSSDDEDSVLELHEIKVPAVLKASWSTTESYVYLNSYFIKFNPMPEDRRYATFCLFIKEFLPEEAKRMEVSLHLSHGRSVSTRLEPSGVVKFDKNEIVDAQKFQEMFLKVIIDRTENTSRYVSLAGDISKSESSTFYLLLPVTIKDEYMGKVNVDWITIRRCLSSPAFVNESYGRDRVVFFRNCLNLGNGVMNVDDIVNSLVYCPHNRKFFFIFEIVRDKDSFSNFKKSTSHVEHLKERFGIQLLYPRQPLLRGKHLFSLRNLLHDRNQNSDAAELEEHFFEVSPELCHLKVMGFSKDMGSSLSLLPSFMHHLQGLLIAIELKKLFSESFPEGSQITAPRVLEAITTERCLERFSLERLEVLGDAFLKFIVGRHLFMLNDILDEGQLTRRRSEMVNNYSLLKFAVKHNIQAYIRDRQFEPEYFYVLGRPCAVKCTKDSEKAIHFKTENGEAGEENTEARCDKCHHWLLRKNISDVVEALIGGFLVDSGFKAATAFLRWMGIEIGVQASQISHIFGSSKKFTHILSTSMDIPALEESLGYQFCHKGLLLEAFVHPSYNKLGGGCYQRMEFLGDALLDYLITSYLFSVYPNLKPGQLTDLRSMCVNNNSFAAVAVARSFDRFIICESSSLEDAINEYVDFVRSGSFDVPTEGLRPPKALGDLVESSVAAILIDSGLNLNTAWKIMMSFLDTIFKSSGLQLNPIRELIEMCQYYDWKLRFPSYKKGDIFFVEARITGRGVSCTSRASTSNKTAAKKMASEQMFVKLKAQGYAIRSKTMELKEVLNSNSKMEPRLIGYDEMWFVPETTDEEEEQHSGINLKTRSINGIPIKYLRNSSILGDFGLQLDGISENANLDFDMPGQCVRGNSKSVLYDFCTSNCWTPPLFECYRESGPSHLKMFSYRVEFEIEDGPGGGMVVECFGTPQMNKKAAGESAAEAALWYLHKQGFLLKHSS